MSDEAAQLVKVPIELIEQVLLKFQAASLDQWKAEITALRKQLKACSSAFDRQQEALDRNTEQIANKQAQIDRLMMEYCPDEMTEEQVKEWKKHQRSVKEKKK